jgi:hypothetical protein
VSGQSTSSWTMRHKSLVLSLGTLVAVALAAACGSGDNTVRPYRAGSSGAPASTGNGPGPGGAGTSASVPGVTPNPLGSVPGHDFVNEDDSPKQSPRLLPAETYIRTYLQLFGGLAPMAVDKDIDGSLFDTWNDYLGALGLADYRLDIPRNGQTSPLMLATFERLGVALCDRAAARDLADKQPVIDQRLVFGFDRKDTPNDAQFLTAFDVLHRTFLGYPAALAPPTRLPRYRGLYDKVVAAHTGKKSEALTPQQFGWSAVCQGLIRHPEFHYY